MVCKYDIISYYIIFNPTTGILLGESLPRIFTHIQTGIVSGCLSLPISEHWWRVRRRDVFGSGSRVLIVQTICVCCCCRCCCHSFKTYQGVGVKDKYLLRFEAIRVTVNLEAGVRCSPELIGGHPISRTIRIFRYTGSLCSISFVCYQTRSCWIKEDTVAFRVIRMNNDYRIHDGRATVTVMRSPQNDYSEFRRSSCWRETILSHLILSPLPMIYIHIHDSCTIFWDCTCHTRHMMVILTKSLGKPRPLSHPQVPTSQPEEGSDNEGRGIKNTSGKWDPGAECNIFHADSSIFWTQQEV